LSAGGLLSGLLLIAGDDNLWPAQLGLPAGQALIVVKTVT
jgi:hypothetical protein